ncbi:MAG: NAD-dependent epimerase/dehydratase family protein [Solirubrobacteraceae bacterium]
MSGRGNERFLVTGALGCIGAWTVARLVAEDAYVVALDIGSNVGRLALLLDREELESVPRVRCDITDLNAVEGVIDDHAITNVVHLAALQVPFCRADPSLGASVNVVGTINMLEAVARRRERMAPLVYASSIAAYEDVDGDHRVPSVDGGLPGTLYGVYKRANESAAALYFRDRETSSIGLRPHTVYGPGRDQGLTSAPTTAMLAAAAGRSYRIPYGGRFQLQYAPDVAATFIQASRAAPTGASVHNLAGHSVDMNDIVSAIESVEPSAEGLITYDETRLPFPEEVDATSLSGVIGSLRDTPVQEGVADTIARFQRLLLKGLVSQPTIDDEPVAS